MVSSDTSQSFRGFLTKALLPATTLTYMLSVVVQLRDAMANLGWQVFSISVFVLVVAWLTFVWTSRTASLVHPSSVTYRYGWFVRLGAIAAALFSALPVWLAFEARQLPDLMVVVTNPTRDQVTLTRFGRYDLLTVAPSGFYYVVTSGEFTIRSESTGMDDSLVVPPGAKRTFRATWFSAAMMSSALAQGDLWLTVHLSTAANARLSSHTMLRLTRSALRHGSLEVIVDV